MRAASSFGLAVCGSPKIYLTRIKRLDLSLGFLSNEFIASGSRQLFYIESSYPLLFY